MPAVNKCIMLGNLTRSPQLSYTPNNTPVVDFGLATNRKFTGSDGTAREDTCFIDVRAFGKLAEVINKYTKVGELLYVEGHVAFEQWEKDGTRHSRHRLIVEHVQLMPQGKGDSKDKRGEIPDSDIPY